MWEGARDRTELQYIDPHSYGCQRCVFLVLRGCLTGAPGVQLSAGWWLSLLHLITNWSPKLHRGSWGPLRLGVALHTTSCLRRLWSPNSSGAPRAPSAGLSLPDLISNLSGPQLSDFLSSQSYIIVQRPLNRPLNPWNAMFDRHQAEITVMQFRGHSLPVHQSMSISGDFYLVPFRQPISAQAISFDYWPLKCVTSFRRIALEWHVCRVEGQITTIAYR